MQAHHRTIAVYRVAKYVHYRIFMAGGEMCTCASWRLIFMTAVLIVACTDKVMISCTAFCSTYSTVCLHFIM